MWGNTQVISGSDVLNVNTAGITTQLVKASYLRPETWKWVFAARLLEASQAQAGEQHIITVDFNLTIGIGRAAITMNSFEQYIWRWGLAGNTDQAPIGFDKWSTQTLGRVRLDTSETGGADPWQTNPAATATQYNGGIGTRSVSNVIDRIVAQDINLQAVVTFATSGSLEGKVEVSAQFAPTTHVRPEWFLDRFPGGEHGG
jgi:hypothetical protein